MEMRGPELHEVDPGARKSTSAEDIETRGSPKAAVLCRKKHLGSSALRPSYAGILAPSTSQDPSDCRTLCFTGH